MFDQEREGTERGRRVEAALPVRCRGSNRQPPVCLGGSSCLPEHHGKTQRGSSFQQMNEREDGEATDGRVERFSSKHFHSLNLLRQVRNKTP